VGEDNESKQLKRISVALTFLLIAAVITIAMLGMQTALLFRLQEPVVPAEQTEKQPQAPALGSTSGAISEDMLRAYAQEFYVNTEFLNRFFPDKIIYKWAGMIHYGEIDPNLGSHAYNLADISWLNSRPSYVAPGYESLNGIDVSFYQGEIDWEKVKEDGIEFAILRVGYRGYGSGALVEDERFAEYLAGAREAGLLVGAYFFSQAINEAEAIEEAEMTLAALGGVPLDFPVIYDFEEISGTSARTDFLSSDQITDQTIAFCERVRAAGYTPMIYANPGFFIQQMNLPELEGYDKWVAQYYKTPIWPYSFSLWQYSSTGSVNGIQGDVDLDLAFVPIETGDNN
jgi:GH25 family lysozyme M1 (1,4-beta-N-acetylmuramidase)